MLSHFYRVTQRESENSIAELRFKAETEQHKRLFNFLIEFDYLNIGQGKDLTSGDGTIVIQSSRMLKNIFKKGFPMRTKPISLLGGWV